MSDKSSHSDNFAHDNLPVPDQMPDFIFDLPELDFPERLNAATTLLDDKIKEGLGHKIALYCGDEAWSYQKLYESANQIAHVLTEDMGIIPGNRILLRSYNNPMMVACWFATLKVGAIAVSTMPLLRARDLVPVIDKARIRHALCDERLADELQEAQKTAPDLENMMFFQDLAERMAGKNVDFDTLDTAASDVALIAFTSGTTGEPKGCMHFHRDIMAMCFCVGQRLLGLKADDVVIGSPPIAFTFGLGALVTFPLYAGASSILLEKSSPDLYLAAIEKFSATASFTAPTAYRALLDKLENYDLSSLKLCVSAGEHLPLPTYNAWFEKTGLQLVDGIGATEMIHIFLSATGADIRPGATGRAIAGYEACIMDAEMKPLPAGSVGRLAVKGPTGCKYLADVRQEKYVQNGWNVTGDTYRMDEDGYFWFCARDDDMIISSGYNIGGPEVEEALLDHAAVQECAVVGSADQERGQLVKAFIVLNEGYEASAKLTKEIQDFVKTILAPYKYPRLIEYVAALPKTETGKIQRFVLREAEKAQD